MQRYSESRTCASKCSSDLRFSSQTNSPHTLRTNASDLRSQDKEQSFTFFGVIRELFMAMTRSESKRLSDIGLGAQGRAKVQAVLQAVRAIVHVVLRPTLQVGHLFTRQFSRDLRGAA